jgi:hypothetical protein
MRFQSLAFFPAGLPFLATLVSACGGSVDATVHDAGPTSDAVSQSPEGGDAAGCPGEAPLCCPSDCQPLTRAVCSSSGWSCPPNAVVLEPGQVCAATCPAPVDAAPPDAGTSVCPATYSVYGDTDPSDNLGHVDPRIYASGTCTGPLEQYTDVDAGGLHPEGGIGIASTDVKVTLQQSAPHSGMFVTTIHQTVPFAFDLTTCLESAGHGTGSAPGGLPGTMALVNDPESVIFPQVQLGTNFAGTDLLFDVSLSGSADFTLNTVRCTFMKN